ncbi:hypothetical protein BC938DRAFT_473533, partial [Jimgerdemannia flammicorona]
MKYSISIPLTSRIIITINDLFKRYVSNFVAKYKMSQIKFHFKKDYQQSVIISGENHTESQGSMSGERSVEVIILDPDI